MWQTLILVAPTWARQPWYLALWEMFISPREKLPKRLDLPTKNQGLIGHPDPKQLNLASKFGPWGTRIWLPGSPIGMYWYPAGSTLDLPHGDAAKWKRMVPYCIAKKLVALKHAVNDIITYLLHLQAVSKCRLHMTWFSSYCCIHA